MNTKIIFLFFLFPFFSWGQKVIEIQDGFIDFVSIAEHAQLVEDSQSFSIESIKGSEVKWEETGSRCPNFNFTSKGYWFKFSLRNKSAAETFYLEVARPLLNESSLYDENGLINTIGDAFPFENRVVKSRKIVFKLHLKKGEEKQYYLYIKSDGEVVVAPIHLWLPERFEEINNEEQYLFGAYYGLLLFVVLIFYFFYTALKEISFLFYVLYVFSQFVFQFSIDGFSYRFLFVNNAWWSNHIVLLSAGITVVLFLIYVQSYLKVKEILPRLNNLFNGLIGLTLLATSLSLFGGKIYEYSFPVINGLSLVALILILVAVIYVDLVFCKVCRYFKVSFLFLVFSGIIFILGNLNIIPASELTYQAIKIGSGIEVILLSLAMVVKIEEIQKEKEDAQKQAVVQLQEMNELKSNQNEKLELQVNERTVEIENQKSKLAEINKDLIDSITYAKRIQYAILPSQNLIDSCLPNSFFLYQPKDIVSGDFYWVSPVTTTKENGENEKLVLFAAADCTGHGVPGAFMSIVGSDLLQLSLSEKEVNCPAEALDFLNKGVQKTLNGDRNEDTIRDGMDIALCAINFKKMELSYAGAKNPLYIVRNKELIIIKADKQPIGAYGDTTELFKNHHISIEKGDMIYTFSDGYADQFGGPKGKKFRYKQFKELLIEISELPTAQQQEILLKEYNDWKGKLEQIDDVLVVGVRV